MIIDFRQGIITYPTSGNLQRFLEFSDGFVSLNAADGRIDLTMASGDENYLHTESATTNAAWGPITPNVDAWLYWNLNGLTAQRTFGITYVQPQYGPTAPASPVNDMHWFDTTNNIMRVYTSGKWVTRIRAFACKINNTTITPLGAGVTNRPFAGTQVGLVGVNIPVGRIIVDSVGQPIRKQNGQLFTTEDEFFINGSPINTIRLEANVLQAEAIENIARFQPVKFVEFGKIALAKYDDTYTTAIAVAMEDIHQGSIGSLCMQGVITNPEWNWDTVGKPLWIHGTIPGMLTDVDPHVSSASLHKVAKPPVARVLSRFSVFFDQGLGGKGDKGEAGDANVPPATTTVLGISKLSVDAVDPANPIVVGDNDPRNFNDRYPLPHNQAATTIIPAPTGILTGVNLQQTLQIINDSFVKRAGDTMLGYLTLNASPAQPMHAASKQYVDEKTQSLNDLTDVVVTLPTQDQVLVYNGTTWVNSTINTGGGQVDDLWVNVTGDTMTGQLIQQLDGIVCTDIAYGKGSGNITSNTTFGTSALSQNTTGDRNTAIGYHALSQNTTGYANVSVGTNTLSLNTAGNENTVIGSASGSNLQGSNNVAIGRKSLTTSTSTYANDNVVIGSHAAEFTNDGRIYNAYTKLYDFVHTQQNTIVGTNAMANVPGSSASVAIGYNAAIGTTPVSQTQGSLIGVTAVGAYALSSTQPFSFGHVAVGVGAGSSVDPLLIDALLPNAYGTINSQPSVYIGSFAASHAPLSSVAIGSYALRNSTGARNIAIGYRAGDSITTGENNIIIGNQAGGGITTQSNQVVIGNSSTTSANINVAWTVTSDSRDKTDIVRITNGLKSIEQLMPMQFKLKNRSTNQPTTPDRYGFIAQDVLQIVDVGSILVDTTDPDHLKIHESMVIPVLVKAVQELSDKLTDALKRIQQLEAK